MVKCATCGTAWTSSGLPLCPVCGTRVEGQVTTSSSPKEDQRLEPTLSINYDSSDVGARKSSNGSAVLELSPQLRKSESGTLVVFTEVDPVPVQALVQDPKPELHRFQQLKKVDLAPAIATPAPAPTLNEAGPIPKTVLETLKHKTALFRIPQASDASAILTVRAEAKILPTPATRMNGPLILGLLAFVPVLLLPLTFAFEGTRVLGILGFCMSGFFTPFAPIAWIVGVSAEKGRRDEGLRSEGRIVVGRWLGQAATLILIAEMTLALVGIAVLRLSGQFPGTFWRYF
jgi:hypothetical protein